MLNADYILDDNRFFLMFVISKNNYRNLTNTAQNNYSSSETKPIENISDHFYISPRDTLMWLPVQF